MSGSYEYRIKRSLISLVVLTGLSSTSNCVISQEATSGADEYRISCASCHGADGRGDGKLASILTVKPADLTVLSNNSGGEFPQTRVYKMIDGREAFYAHGDRAMPVWGIRYLLEHATRYGDYAGEQAVQARIIKLLTHIQSIQE